MSHYIEYESWTFPANKIKAGNIHLATSLLFSSLEVNSFLAEVECDDPSILDFKRNAQLLYYPSPDQPMVWRVQNIERIAPALYRISATSTIGLLTEGKHYGGMYSEYGGISHGTTAETLIKEICGSVPVNINADLRDLKIYGYLPIAAPRDNLSQVLFALGATIGDDADGILRVEPLPNDVKWTVAANRMYAESKVVYTAPVTSVIVSEHKYVRGTDEKELYSGDSQEGDIVTFSEPVHTLTAEGFNVLASGANWAKLSQGSGVLRGHSYIHSTREVEEKLLDGADPNIKSVSDATLVTLVNSGSVVKRLANFYRSRETIEAPVKYQGELPGDRMDIFHPFGHTDATGCLQSVDIVLSNVLKAQEKILVGFTPEPEDEYYDSRAMFTADGIWIVPDGVTHIRVAIIGGGDGGYRGGNGATGTPGVMVLPTGGAGGAAGQGGNGGKIFVVDLTVIPGEGYPVTIGAGGAGGTSANSPAGSPGGSSTFGDYSSDSGASSAFGFVDPTTGDRFAMPGNEGIRGGDGGGSDNLNGKPGESVGTAKGGSGGSGAENVYGGGGGGGAAFGRDGKDGENAVPKNSRGGNGGDGAAAIESTGDYSYFYGRGGQGGNGGGGGGNGGISPFSSGIGVGGFGGKGTNGGNGISGIVIIYYRASSGDESG